MVYTRILFAGLVAGVVMGMVEMLFSALSGEGFWTPLVFIGATVLRDLQSLTPPAPFLPVAVLLGMTGHLVTSMALGLVFAWLTAPRLRGWFALVLGGIVYGLIVFAATWFIVLPLVDPVMFELDATLFAISHVVWGATLGGLLAWYPAPALNLSSERV
jgi:hypothetical protein